MQRAWDKRILLVGICVVAIVCVASGGAATDPNGVLRKSLMEIRAGGRTIAENPAALESRALQLIKDHNTPSEKGMIYATIASVYSDRGFGPGDEGKTRASKTVEYARKALENPLGVLTACRMYGRLTDGLNAASRGQVPNDRWPEARREAIVPCLKGLKLALDNKVPKERPTPPPRVPLPNILGGGGRAGEEKRRKYEEYLTAYRGYRYLDELYEERWALTQQCAGLYSSEPYDVEEFRSYAQKILVGHDEEVTELVQFVQGRIDALRGPAAPAPAKTP